VREIGIWRWKVVRRNNEHGSIPYVAKRKTGTKYCCVRKNRLEEKRFWTRGLGTSTQRYVFVGQKGARIQ
jgi:hypothetical protein